VKLPAPGAAARYGLVVVLALAVGALGCAGPRAGGRSPAVEGVTGPPVELAATPFFPQEGFQCGPTALATILAASGVAVTPNEVRDEVYLPKRHGSLQLELLAASRRHGRLPYEIVGGVPALLAELRGGRPVLVLQNVGWQRWPVWHYAVVVGALRDPDRFVLRSGHKKRRVMSAREFVETWQGSDFWGIVALHPGEMPAHVDRRGYLKAAAALEATSQPEAARAAYRAALDRWPGDAIAWLGLGNTAFALGEWGEAEAQYRRILDKEPGNAVARNNLAQVLAEQGCFAAALAEIDTALAKVAEDDPLRTPLTGTRVEIVARMGHAPAKGGRAAQRP
jgi:hypothetical protein